jgi:hypothetical protein
MLIPLSDDVLLLHTDAGGKLETPRDVYADFCDVVGHVDDLRHRCSGPLFVDPAGVIWSRTGASMYQRANGYRLV